MAAKRKKKPSQARILDTCKRLRAQFEKRTWFAWAGCGRDDERNFVYMVGSKTPVPPARSWLGGEIDGFPVVILHDPNWTRTRRPPA